MREKETIYRIILLIIAIGIITTGCRKYPDGPDLSFRSKKQRLFGYWNMEKWIQNNVEDSAQLAYQRKFGFAKDGTYYFSLTDPTIGTVINFNGTWEFRDRKEQLVLGLDDPLNGMQYEVWDILRLTSKELWLENVSSGNIVEWKLKAE